jgi:hypothetical protein
MGVEKLKSGEALALERVAAAAREVQAASTALKAHFMEDGGRQPSMLELARFAAAKQCTGPARPTLTSAAGRTHADVVIARQEGYACRRS